MLREMPPRFLLQNFRVRSGIFTFPGLEVVNLVDRYVLDFFLDASCKFSYPPYTNFARDRCLTYIDTEGCAHPLYIFSKLVNRIIRFKLVTSSKVHLLTNLYAKKLFLCSREKLDRLSVEPLVQGLPADIDLIIQS